MARYHGRCLGFRPGLYRLLLPAWYMTRPGLDYFRDAQSQKSSAVSVSLRFSHASSGMGLRPLDKPKSLDRAFFLCCFPIAHRLMIRQGLKALGVNSFKVWRNWCFLRMMLIFVSYRPLKWFNMLAVKHLQPRLYCFGRLFRWRCRRNGYLGRLRRSSIWWNGWAILLSPRMLLSSSLLRSFVCWERGLLQTNANNSFMWHASIRRRNMP